MLSIRFVSVAFMIFVVAGCNPPPPPNEVAMDNLKQSWTTGSYGFITSEFSNPYCMSEVESDSIFGNYIVCKATMKGLVHESVWHCSTEKNGRCIMLR